MKFPNNIDLTKNEIQNFKVHQLASAPASPFYGQIWQNTTDGNLYIYTTQWNYFATAAQVIGTSLDKFATPTASVSIGGFRITQLGDPTQGTDAVNKNYVDALLQGVEWKNPVRVVSTANLTKSGLQTVDGVSLAVGDRIALIGQTTGSENGIWVVASGAWSRSVDADAGSELLGMTFFVSEGSTNGNKIYNCTTDGPITVNSTALTFVQIGAGTSYLAGNGIILTGSTFSINSSVVVQKQSTPIGNGTNTSYSITHSLNTLDLSVVLRKISTGELWIADATATSATQLTVNFGAYVPANGEFQLTVMG